MENKLRILCIENNTQKIKEYMCNCEITDLVDCLKYIMVNNMDTLFIDLINEFQKYINIYDEQETYFESACLGGNITIINWLLDNGFDMNKLKTCIAATVHAGNTEATKLLLNCGANIHINYCDYFPIITALLNNNDEIVQLFLQYDCIDINDVAISLIKNIKKEDQQKLLKKFYSLSELS